MFRIITKFWLKGVLLILACDDTFKKNFISIIFCVLKLFGFFEPPYCATFRIGQVSWCLPYAGFLKINSLWQGLVADSRSSLCGLWIDYIYSWFLGGKARNMCMHYSGSRYYNSLRFFRKRREKKTNEASNSIFPVTKLLRNNTVGDTSENEK